jgi:LysM repeat protein
MTDMRKRGGSIGLVVLAGLLVACVPDPPGRVSPSAALVIATPSPTPIPTPEGPTPSPSYVRPTPTPQPSFFVYTVVSGDSLDKIAKHFGTTGKSIAYWNRLTYPSLDPDSGQYKPNYIKVGWKLQLIPNAQVDPENLPGTGTPDPSAEPDPVVVETPEPVEVIPEDPVDLPTDEPT